MNNTEHAHSSTLLAVRHDSMFSQDSFNTSIVLFGMQIYHTQVI